MKYKVTLYSSKSDRSEEVRQICEKLKIETGSGNNDALVEDIFLQLPYSVSADMEFTKKRQGQKIKVEGKIIGFSVTW